MKHIYLSLCLAIFSLAGCDSSSVKIFDDTSNKSLPENLRGSQNTGVFVFCDVGASFCAAIEC